MRLLMMYSTVGDVSPTSIAVYSARMAVYAAVLHPVPCNQWWGDPTHQRTAHGHSGTMTACVAHYYVDWVAHALSHES